VVLRLPGRPKLINPDRPHRMVGVAVGDGCQVSKEKRGH